MYLPISPTSAKQHKAATEPSPKSTAPMAPTPRSNSPALQPYWKCLFGEVFRQDPTPSFIKHAYLIIYILLHLPVIFPKTFGQLIFDFHDSYFTFDDTHLSESSHHNSFRAMFELITLTTGISYTALFISFTIATSVFTVLIWSDATTKRRPFPWPESWETNNNSCYSDMFCEPTRENSLIRHPGNALSNFLYLLLSLIILISTISRGLLGGSASETAPMLPGLLLSDFIFGIMLFILSLSSVIWHSCNAYWSHSVDLWSMEAVIVYLTIRLVSLAVYVFLRTLTEGSMIASFLSPGLCFVLYMGHIYGNAVNWYNKHASRLWQDLCPFAARNRLPNSPYVVDNMINNTPRKTDGVSSSSRTAMLDPLWLSEVCIFALLPVSSNVLNWVFVKTAFHTVGSPFLVRLTNYSLVFAWNYRLLERWCFDGNRLVSYCEEKIKESTGKNKHIVAILWTAAAAIFSPTAALHFWTGVTLCSAYCHSRTIEIFMLLRQS